MTYLPRHIAKTSSARAAGDDPQTARNEHRRLRAAGASRRKLADKRPTERIVGPAAGAATLAALLELGLPPLWAMVLAAIATIAPEVVSRTVDAIDQRRAERESGR